MLSMLCICTSRGGFFRGPQTPCTARAWHSEVEAAAPPSPRTAVDLDLTGKEQGVFSVRANETLLHLAGVHAQLCTCRYRWGYPRSPLVCPVGFFPRGHAPAGSPCRFTQYTHMYPLIRMT